MFKPSQASDGGSIFTAPNGRSTRSGELPKTFSTNRNRRKITCPITRATNQELPPIEHRDGRRTTGL